MRRKLLSKVANCVIDMASVVSEPEQAIVPYYTGKLIDFKAPEYRW